MARSNSRRRSIKVACSSKPKAEASDVRGSAKSACDLSGKAWLLVMIVPVLLYWNTIGYPMVFDDDVYLARNPFMKDSASFGFIFHLADFVARPAAMGLEPDLATNFTLRPVGYATFFLNHLLDGLRPNGYRVVNIAIHAANAVLIWWMVAGSLRRLQVTSATMIATMVALLFAVHPLATESVTYVTQRFTSLGSLFYLLTLLCYFTADQREELAERRRFKIAAFVSLLLGMWSKECTFTAPMMVIVADWWLFRTPFNQALRKAVPLLVLLPLIPLMVAANAWAQAGGDWSLRGMVHLVNSRDVPWDHGHFIITEFTVVMEYLRLLLWPAGLNADPQWPLYTSLFSIPVLLSLAVIVLALGAAVVTRVRLVCDQRLVVAGFGVVWFLATIVVSSGLVPLPDLMAEHRAYLPSVGFFVAIVCLLDWGWSKAVGDEKRLIVHALTMVVVIALCVRTVDRNREAWSTRVAFWEDVTSKSPDKFRGWLNLGIVYADARRTADSIPCYRRAIELEPRLVGAHYNLAASLNNVGQFQEALEVCHLLEQRRPEVKTTPEHQYNLACAAIGIGEHEKDTGFSKPPSTRIPITGRRTLPWGSTTIRPIVHAKRLRSGSMPDGCSRIHLSWLRSSGKLKKGCSAYQTALSMLI